MATVNNMKLMDHPSYLKWFGTGAVTLMYAKKPSVSSNSQDGNRKSDTDLETSVEDCDLTGQPLFVDLGDNSDATTFTQQSHDPIWPKDELKHFPLSVRQARRELNTILRKGNTGTSQPHYVLCAGDDNSKTILLGGNSNDYMGCSVQLLKPVPADEVESSLGEMVLAHVRYCLNNNSQVKYLVKMSYNVYGRDIKKTTDPQASKLEVDGHISVDITALKKVFKPSKNSAADVKMNASVIVGHPHLKLSFIWQQLLKLQRILSIISDGNFETNVGNGCQEISLCNAPLDKDDILQSITNLVSTKVYAIKRNDVVDLNDLRNFDFLDRLWDILSCCGNVSELKDNFSFLFSKLLEMRSEICLMDVSENIGILIKQILEGQRKMPKISVKQSLEYLCELGTRKLKLDFQTIISLQFPGFGKTQVDCIWKSFVTTPPSKSKTFEKSMVNMHSNKLAYLCQLYVASELFYLVKDQVNMSEDGYKLLCKSIEREYILDACKIKDFAEVILTPLRTISFNLDMNCASFIDSMLPSQWTLTMETGSVTTIYHLSAQPVYPPQIMCYVPYPETDGPFFYVTRMNRRYAKLC